MTFALSAESVACIRGGRTVFSGVGFALAAGGALRLEGPNGAGKTSLLRLLAGFLPAAAGRVTLYKDGTAVTEAEERGAYVGWCGERDAVKAQLTVRELLSFHARLYRRGGVDAALSRFGLSALAERPGRTLSAGQKRRLALARLWLSGRPLWLMDEPLSALDAAGRAMVTAAVAEHRASGGIVVAASHEALGFAAETLRLGGKA